MKRRLALDQLEARIVLSSMLLKDFNGPTVPQNLAGDTYPSEYGGAGSATVSLSNDDSQGISGGHSVQFNVTSGGLYAQFNPYDTSTRAFARDYSANPAAWQYNTYDRMSFWI